MRRAVRVLSSDDQMGGRDHLRAAGGVAHPVVEATGAGVAESSSASAVATAKLGLARGRGYNGRGDAGLAPTASTRCGEDVGVLGWVLRRLWPQRRGAQASWASWPSGGGLCFFPCSFIYFCYLI